MMLEAKGHRTLFPSGIRSRKMASASPRSTACCYRHVRMFFCFSLLQHTNA